MAKGAKKSGALLSREAEEAQARAAETLREADRFLREMEVQGRKGAVPLDQLEGMEFLSEEEDNAAAAPAAEAGAAPVGQPGKASLAADPQAQQIALGLGRGVEELERVVAQSEAGEEKGQVFYALRAGEVEVLVRQDGMRAYVRGLSAEAAGQSQVLKVLEECHLRQVEVQAPKKKKGGWIGVAQGKPPVAGKAAQLEFCCPGPPEEPLTLEVLGLLSLDLQRLFQAGGFDPQVVPELGAVAVVPGQVVARLGGQEESQAGQDVFGRPVAPLPVAPADRMEPGGHMILSPTGEYQAEGYGYLCIEEGRLSVWSPTWMDPGNMCAYWVLLDPRPHPVAAEMVHQRLEEAGVMGGIQEEQVRALAGQVQQGAHAVGIHLVAQGASAVDGQDVVVEMLVDLRRWAGKERSDGSIDFREVNFTPVVEAGQLIARRRPPTLGTPGLDLKGKVLEAKEGRDQVLQAGVNVEVKIDGESEVFAAAIEGVAKRNRDELSVIRQLTRKGDVDPETGNLDFKGDICIDGSVGQGFSVKATGDITISGTVEAGSTVLALGSIVVSKGIMGSQTRVQAQGSVRAQFIQEALVVAGGDIEVGNYAYHAHLQADGKVVVHKGTGTRGGGVLGGEVWAQAGIELHLAGSPNGVLGLLAAGLQPAQAQEADKLKAGALTCQAHILKILQSFNLTRINPAQIRAAIAAANGSHNQILMGQARQLEQLVHLYQKLQAELAELKGQIRTGVKEAQIKVMGTACWGVTIRIGEHQRQLTEDLKSPRFHLHEDRLVER